MTPRISSIAVNANHANAYHYDIILREVIVTLHASSISKDESANVTAMPKCHRPHDLIMVVIFLSRHDDEIWASLHLAK